MYANNYPTRCNYIQFIYICKPLYMFRLVSPPIIRTSCHCIHSICLTCLVLLDLMVLIFGEEYKFLPIIVQQDATTYSLFISVNRSTCFGWYLHPPTALTSRSRQVAVTVLLMPDAVDTVTWGPDDGWRFQPKRVERFTDINKLCIWIKVDQLGDTCFIMSIYCSTCFRC